MNSGATLQALQAAADALTSCDDREALRHFQAAQDALDTAKAARLASMELSRSYELDGASSLNVWVRNELRMSAKQAHNLVKMPQTIAQLPAVARAAEGGEIRADHVAAFTYGIKHVGSDVVAEHEAALVEVARRAEPNELFKVVRHLREVVYPDDLDKAWAEGMDRQDIQINSVFDGWHINGFLGATTGAMFKTVLDSISKPDDPDDQRTGAQRRVDGLDALLRSILQSGLPSDKGVRPQLSVILDATEDAPAQLAGFGSIGPKLLDYLTCSVDLTPIYTRNGEILDVGREHRLATVKQRRAVLARQGNECAAPGCHNTHLEIHHIAWWSRGGKTDLDNLVGLCTRCHHLVHRDLLVIHPNNQHELNFTNNRGRPIARRFHQRVATHEITRQKPRPYAPMRT